MWAPNTVTAMGFHWLQDPCSFQRGGSFCSEADISGPTVPEELGHYQNDSVSLKKGPYAGYLTRDCPRLKLRFWMWQLFFFFTSLFFKHGLWKVMPSIELSHCFQKIIPSLLRITATDEVWLGLLLQLQHCCCPSTANCPCYLCGAFKPISAVRSGN